MPLLLNEVDSSGMMNMNSKGSFGAALGSAALGAAGAAGAAGYKLTTINGGGQFYNQMDMASMDQGMSGHLGMMRDEFSTYDTAMALNEDFLNHYFSNVSGDILEITQKRTNGI